MIEQIEQEVRRSLVARTEALDAATFSDVIDFQITTQQIREMGQPRSHAPRRYLRGFLRQMESYRCIYQISVDDLEQRQALKSAFNAGCDGERDFVLPKQNNHDWWGSILYVGTSASIVSRLREHLWRAPRKTYAMKIGSWSGENLEATLCVKVFAVLGQQPEVIAQEVEDALWDLRRPSLGKRGGK